MRVVAISDTHERHGQIVVPNGDVLICAGDISHNGKPDAVFAFLSWMNRQPHPNKILVAGNHDFYFERTNPATVAKRVAEFAPTVTYLQDSGVGVEGMKVWGSPWQPVFFDWAFNLKRGKALAAKWALIPDDTDILVTHGPPFETLDVVPSGRRVGCEMLAARLSVLSVRLHVFGHIHHSYGAVERDGRVSVNAAICDERYRAVNAPVVVDIERGR